MYVVGIDVGGTNTDAALIKGGRVLALAKTPTKPQELFAGTKKALEEVLRHYGGEEPLELHLSTTLSTNAIVEGSGVPTLVVAVPGPGVNLKTLDFDFPFCELQGYIDHRGRETAPLNFQELQEVVELIQANRVQALAVVGKFSHRNPQHEEEIAQFLGAHCPLPLSLGHRLSGRANFPRRIVTAYLNARVAQKQGEFAQMWLDLSKKSALPLADILVLKADGGTMTLKESAERPVETILSGPAASIMGALALTKQREENLVVLDIGGTTTDIALVVQGEPLFERSGAVISGYRTLVPALLTRSVGLGGDSAISWEEKAEPIKIGPQRAGRAVCLGGQKLTPTDAAVALGLAELGDGKKALAACRELGFQLGLQGEEVARAILEAFTAKLAQAVRRVYEELENTPLYTVSEILAPPDIAPRHLLGLGAPAGVFTPRVAQALNLPYEVLPFCAGANAIGAAAARATAGIVLYADTELGVVTIPEMGYRGDLKRALFFDLGKARHKARQKTKEYARLLGLQEEEDIYVLEEESFNVVRGFHTVGQIHMVRTQLRPQVRRIERGEQNLD